MCEQGNKVDAIINIEDAPANHPEKSKPPNILELAQYIENKKHLRKIDLFFKIAIQKVNQ